jgi:hypothetical protein
MIFGEGWVKRGRRRERELRGREVKLFPDLMK